MNVYEKLMNVQFELKAPKSQFNSFGKYNYRSCEDILEALKPLLSKVKAVVNLTDSIDQIGDRIYLKATAIFIDIENGEKIEVNALAREDEVKKGMDSAQVTGSVSSYARKYALNGLFCIDDTKDSDSTNTHGKEDSSKASQNKAGANLNPSNAITLSKDKIDSIEALAKKKGYTEAYICKFKKVGSYKELNYENWNDAMKWLASKEDKK